MTSSVPIAIIDVGSLTGKALDYAVVKAQGFETSVDGEQVWVSHPRREKEFYKVNIPSYCTNLSLAWSILNTLSIEYKMHQNGVQASFIGGYRWYGKNYIEAGLRCFVASISPLGLIEIPDNLLHEKAI